MKNVRKIIAGAVLVTSVFTMTAFANSKIPGGTVILGKKAFSLDYANQKANEKEIRTAMFDADAIYIKLVSGTYVDNVTASKVSETLIKVDTYKDEAGTITVGDGASVSEELEVISIE